MPFPDDRGDYEWQGDDHVGLDLSTKSLELLLGGLSPTLGQAHDLELPAGLLSRRQQDVVIAMFDSLGLMCRRDVPGARDAVGRMSEPTYWGQTPFKWFSEKIDAAPGPINETQSWLINGYSLSGKDDLDTLAMSILTSMSITTTPSPSSGPSPPKPSSPRSTAYLYLPNESVH